MRSALHVTIGVVITALVFHTWATMGLIVPVTVVGSSMAPTLLGPHRMFRCADCKYNFVVGLDQLPPGDAAICPQCLERRAVVADTSDRHGDRLVVDRTAFAWRRPRRWEVVVFRCPGNSTTLCVKRILGLPGETVAFSDGDLVVNGSLVQKTLDEQRALRQLVYREGTTSHELKKPSPRPSPKGRGGEEEFVFRLPRDWPVTDEAGFNQGIVPPPNRVADVMLTFDARLEGRGQLHVTAAHPAGQCKVVVDFCEATIRVKQSDKLLANTQFERTALPAAQFTEWTFSLFDRQILVAIDDRVVLTAHLDKGQQGRAGSKLAKEPQLILQAENLTGTIRNLAVWRDVYYGVRHGDRLARDGRASWRLGEQEFFVAGDNAVISDDSRSWPSGAGLDANLLIGRPFGVR